MDLTLKSEILLLQTENWTTLYQDRLNFHFTEIPFKKKFRENINFNFIKKVITECRKYYA